MLIGPAWSVVVAVVVECCCCIPFRLVRLFLTFAPSVLTFAPCALTFCTLCLWCYPSINQRKYSTCTHGRGHWLQLELVVFLLQPLVQTFLAPVVVPPIATCTGGLFPSTHWRTYSPRAQTTCTVRWWSVVHIL